MSKIIGGRIDDSLYNKIKKDGRSYSVIIRDALTKYFSKSFQESDVNMCKQLVNGKKKCWQI